MYNKFSPESIENYAKKLIGKTFKDAVGEKDIKGKGGLGVLLEEHYFGYKPNSDKEPDFKEAGVELKSTPYKKNKNSTYSAKERLVLNIINYMKDYEGDFEQSGFYKKNKLILLIYYFFDKELDKLDYPINYVHLFEFPEVDLEIIKRDWETIVNKIKEGKAHEISEADTIYLSACTKGANKECVREQPFSNIVAKQRAFSLKP
ncbi:MutH/Sau3AI family endonuclease [Clostridium gasigenes]|uniref:MutH/Sau3AI family endonuclease n=1 Tax=Clostridium gasigenes TaxID=94869 RepID=UPI00209B9A6C|nr:MutH/Sau3AI family endonuclease [Clostridium gasigenes]